MKLGRYIKTQDYYEVLTSHQSW